MKIKWLKEGLEMVPLNESLKKKIEKWVANVDPEELKKLNEYEENGDSIVCPLIDSYLEGGIVIKIVKHKGKYKVSAGIYGQAGYVEEYYIANLIDLNSRS